MSDEKTPMHTPGPWEVVRAAIDNSRMSAIASQSAPDKGHIAHIYNKQASGTDAERAANARLMAAAPEMLIALENVHEQGETEMPAYVWKSVIAAIANAKGETP